MEVKLELKDKTPFYIRPFPIKEEEKIIVDREMRKVCLLGILRKGLSSYSSPIMLIPREMSGIPCIITDFRHLNSWLVRLNCSFPLVMGCYTNSRIFRVWINLSYGSKKMLIILWDCQLNHRYTVVLLHIMDQTHYLYQRLGMGLSVSPAIWQTFINKVLDEIPDRKHLLAIMDDCMIHSKKKDHLNHLIALLKVLIRNGLKIISQEMSIILTEIDIHGSDIIDQREHTLSYTSEI